MILHSLSQSFVHNLSLMNLDIVILKYEHYVFSYMLVQEMKSCTLHQLGLEKLLLETSKSL